MRPQGSIKVRADRLAEAVTAVVPVPRPRKNAAKRKRKPYPISLVYFANDEALGVKEARHALRGYRVRATGDWPEKVQVDGQILVALVGKYPADSEIELVALDEELAILQGRSQILLKRFDPPGKRGIVETPPKTKGYYGRVEWPPDSPPTGRFEWNDLWLFSARVPFPQHRKSTGEARKPDEG